MTMAVPVLLFSVSNIDVNAWISIVFMDDEKETIMAVSITTATMDIRFMSDTDINDFASTCTVGLKCDELWDMMMLTAKKQIAAARDAAALNDMVDDVVE